MQRIKSLLHEVAKYNTIDQHNCFHFDPRYNVALAGYRRLYGAGDCLVRIQADDVDLGGYARVPFNFYYSNEEPLGEAGLPGKELADGRREVVDAETAQSKFAAVYSQLSDGKDSYALLLNPKMICDFIEERIATTSFADKKINIQVFEGVNSLGEMAAKVGSRDGQVFVEFKLGGKHMGYAYIDDKQSRIATNRLTDGQLYIVKAVGTDEHGNRWVKVIREYKRGVRLAIQHLRNGLLMPNHLPRYTVLDDREANIGIADILDVPLIDLPDYRQGNEEGNFFAAPMIHVDLDTLYRAIKPMDSFKVVEMRFKDSITGIYLSTLSMPGQMKIDAILGPTSPYKSGKVYTA